MWPGSIIPTPFRLRFKRTEFNSVASSYWYVITAGVNPSGAAATGDGDHARTDEKVSARICGQVRSDRLSSAHGARTHFC